MPKPPQPPPLPSVVTPGKRRRALAALSPAGAALPAVIARTDEPTRERFLEFFTAQIRNPNTRAAYARAVTRFFGWADELGLELEDLTPRVVATYVELLGRELAPATVKQHLAAVRRLCDYLVTGQALASNPAGSVRGPKHVVRKGKTPVLYEEDARAVLQAIPDDTAVGLRDRALLGAMIYSFARVGAVVRMRRRDYYSQGRRAWLVLHEKGGKYLQVPAHHKVAAALDDYLELGGLTEAPADSPLFRSSLGRSGRLTDRAMSRHDVHAMVKRRAKAAGLPAAISCHSFRATGITDYLQNGGSLEVAAQIAGHASTRTTQLYDRRSDEVALEEIERIRI